MPNNARKRRKAQRIEEARKREAEYRSYLKSLEKYEYDGPELIIADLTNIDDCVKKLSSMSVNDVIALDTETEVEFEEGKCRPKGIPDKVSIIQIACPDSIFIFQRIRLGDFEKLRFFLENYVIKTSVGITSDVVSLRKGDGVNIPEYVDLHELGKLLKIKRAGTQGLFATYFNKNFTKGKKSKFSRWNRLNLKDYQIEYARDDVWINWLLYKAMSKHIREIIPLV
jgi:ribonuclease D